MINLSHTRDWSVFNARDYLHEYYADIGSENLAILHFMVRALSEVSPDSVLLDFGGGPTVYSLIASANHAREIHFCDYLDTNLEQVRMWLECHPQAFNWTEFIKTTLVLEGNDYSKQGVCDRERKIRQRVTQVLHCDANLPQPIETDVDGYDVLVTNFCAESATDSVEQWRRFVTNITSLIKPGGRLIMSTLKGASSYGVGAESFPAVNIMEDDLMELLIDIGFNYNTVHIESVPADRPSRHYQGLMFVSAIKRT
ncbi:MAG: hypothetical protein GC179_03565 [Anaerolineaceae bacterium]|nr:hypothetical protein [Anaerolineaceae bacterium]